MASYRVMLKPTLEEVFETDPGSRRIANGNVAREDVYAALGQTASGRYLIVFYILKLTREALVISARDATAQERRRYGRK